MRRFNTIAVLFLGLAGCGPSMQGSPSMQQSVAQARTKLIGKPISERIAALGRPESVTRVNPRQVAYTFAVSETTSRGGNVSAGGVSATRTPVNVSTTTCRGTFIVHAPRDDTPLRQRLIEDVQSSGCR